MQSVRWIAIVGATVSSLSCAGVQAPVEAPADAISWSDCQQPMHSKRITAYVCGEYSWVRFPRPAGDHAKVVAEASARAVEDHGWQASSLDLPATSFDAADEVSAIVFTSREADTVIKVTLVASRADATYPTGHAVTVCSREYDAYQERLPDPASAVADASTVCSQGSSRLRGL